MACVALTSLMATIELEFLQPIPRLFLHDRPLSKSFFKNLSFLQSFLQKVKKSSTGDDSGATLKLRELEIQIRDFALKAEDDIEIQLSYIILAEDKEHSEKAFHELHQTLREAAKNATELLKILTAEKESCVSETEMASVALTIVITKFEYYFLLPFPTVYLDDEASMVPFFQNLYSLQAFLQEEEKSRHDGGALKDMEIKIRDFALKAEDDIEIQLSNILEDVAEPRVIHPKKEKIMEKILGRLNDYMCFRAPQIEYQPEKASHKLHQTLGEAAEIAEELFKSIYKEKENERAREMTCNALTSLRETIEQGFVDDEEVRRSFLEKISSLQAFLQKESSVAVKDLETKIKHFSLKAVDDIYIQLGNISLAKDTEHEEEASQELHRIILEAAEIAAELLNIINSIKSNEVDELANKTQPSNTAWLKHVSKSANVESNGSSQQFLRLGDRMVGRHRDCRLIKNQLFSNYYLKTISIVGMVGIGKTMLAKNFYGDTSVASHFDVRGWITIPQDYNKSRMLSDLLQSITPAEPNVITKESTPDELQMQVRKCLIGRRFLIVLDNILSKQAWMDIRECVPDDKVGSCILITTSHNSRDYYDCEYTHNMTLLDPKESWDLFSNILPIKKHVKLEFEKIRSHIVEKCDGLPQLIIEVAKRLSECNNIQEGWKKIEKELESFGFLDRKALTVSYNALPHHLKVCFLYFGVFPKRYKVLVKILIRLWIAEGFVKPLEHNELENQAYGYLQELIDRSLLLIDKQSFNGKIKTCRMHSALHSFCVGEAQKEGILCAVDTQQHSGLPLDAFANSCRWLSLYSHSFDYYVLFSTNIPRSIFFFHENPGMPVPLKLLRVLVIDTSIFIQRVPMHLEDLVFLRYLSVTHWFKDLDDVVLNNPNLQTLVVSGNTGAPTVHLPSSIWKLPRLKHLELGNSYILDPPSIVKRNLQSLSWVVRPINCCKEVYTKFPSIKKLKIFLKHDIEPGHTGRSCSSPIILSFAYLEELEKLSISVSIGCNVALSEYYTYPSRLKKLKLSGIDISERDLTEIGKLRYLTVLKFENAFHGTVWNIAERGFRELRFLLLEAKNLKQWVASHNDFPLLRHLVLRSCYCLEQIPKDLARIYPLKSIELEGCGSSLVASAKQYQRDTGNSFVEIKIPGPEYDESHNTHAEVSM